MNALPLNELQTTIRNIWESVLGMKVEDDEANFFVYGGNSIQAMEIMHQVNEAYNTNFSIADFFDALTVHQLSLLVNNRDVMSAA